MRIWPVVACCAILNFPAFAEPAKSVVSAAEKQKAAYLKKTLEQLVNLNSGSDDGPGLARVQDVLVQRLQDLGATVEISEAPPSPGKVVIARFEGKGERSILLMDHYDTVFSPGDHDVKPVGVEAAADRIRIVLRAGDDAVDASSRAQPRPLLDQVGDAAAVAQFTQAALVEAGQHRDDKQLQRGTTPALDRSADDVAVAMDGYKADPALGDPFDAAPHRLADVEHLGVEKDVLARAPAARRETPRSRAQRSATARA